MNNIVLNEKERLIFTFHRSQKIVLWIFFAEMSSTHPSMSIIYRECNCNALVIQNQHEFTDHILEVNSCISHIISQELNESFFASNKFCWILTRTTQNETHNLNNCRKVWRVIPWIERLLSISANQLIVHSSKLPFYMW